MYILILTFMLVIYMLRFHICNKFVSIGLQLHQSFYGDKYFTVQNFKKFKKHTKSISRSDFNNSFKINANKDLVNQYTIVDLGSNLCDVKRIINYRRRRESILKLLEVTLEYVHLDGKKMTVDDCVIVDLIQSKGQYFPSIHTDVEWETFSKHNGYQIWYLYKNDDKVGNMFILDTPNVLPSTYLSFEKNNKVDVIAQDSRKVITTYGIDEISDDLKYLDMKAGECLIFGKNLYHTSDYRLSLKDRMAINFRVLFKNPDGSIDLNPNCVGSYNSVTKFKIMSKNIRRDGNKIYPEMFDLLEMI